MRKTLFLRGATLLASFLPLMALTATLHGAAAQESVLDTVKKRGTLVAGVKTDYAPFGYIDDKGVNAGFDVEIVKYLAQKLNVKVELRTVTSGNRIPMLQTGTVDLLVASITIYKERAEVIDFSVPYVITGIKFLAKKGSNITGYADLADKTVVYTQGTGTGDKVTKEQPKAKHLVLQDKPQAVQAILQGKAAAYIDDGPALSLFAKQHPELEVLGDAAPPSPMGIGMRQNDAKWRNTINFALIDMWNDGTYHKLHREFFGSEPDPKFQIYPWQL